MNREETKLCREFLRVVGCWHCRIEYAPGGTAGNPDVMVLVDGRLVPIEFKLTGLWHGMHAARLRSSQVRWHKAFREAGGFSLLVAGTSNQKLVWITLAGDDLPIGLPREEAVEPERWLHRLRELAGWSMATVAVAA